MEPLDALNELVALALRKTGAKSEPALFRSLMISENYLYAWRKMLAKGDQGPAFSNIVPLLEAAGVFARPTPEDLSRQAAELEAEAERLRSQAAALTRQQKHPDDR